MCQNRPIITTDGKWKNMIVKKNSGGYDQFGALFGQVKIHEKEPDNADFDSYFKPKFEEFELNLPGLRQRRWGVNKVKHLHRTGVFLGTAVDGTVFEIGALSSKIGLTHTQFGSVRLPNGKTYTIDWTDFHLSNIAEYQNENPQSIIIKFEAQGKKFNVFINFKSNSKIRLCGGNPIDWNAFVIPIEIVINSQIGFGLATFWYPRSDFENFEVDEVSNKIRRVFYRLDHPSPSHMVISQEELIAQSLFISGGKGASLAILKQIEESGGSQFLPHNNNEQVLNALIDQLSSNPLNRSIKNKHSLHEHIKRRNRSGSDAQTVFVDPQHFHFNFTVPAFFILSTSAMKQHIKTNLNLSKVLKELEAIANQRVPGDLKDACDDVSEEFFKTTLNLSLQEELISKIREMRTKDPEIRFAVRSSCVLEDGEHTSSAGQNETFLGLKDDEEVIEGILQCWISLFSYQSVYYRVQHIQPVISEMAVVIQEMIPADSAGVMFTTFPTNGDPHKMMITANWGLGQTVVGGQVNPDTHLIKRDYRDGLTVLASKMGDKKITCQMDDIDIAKEIPTDEKKQTVYCLNEGLILKLARVGIILEKFYGSPRDIEWAISKNKIYILQARPITSLQSFSNFELLHEHDCAIMSPQDFLTRANVGEVLPKAVSVLAQSTLTKAVEKGIRKMSRMENQELHLECFLFIQHNLFINVYMVMLRQVAEKISILEEITGLAVFGYNFITPEIHEIALRRNPNSFSGLLNVCVLIMNTFNTDKRLKKLDFLVAELINKYSDDHLSKFKVSIDLFKDIEESIKIMEDVFIHHNMFSQNSMIYQMIIFKILTQGSLSFTTSHQSDVATILSSVKDVESAEIPELLNEIALKIILQGKKDEFLEVDSKKASKWLEKNCEEVFTLFEQFMKKHGHRGLSELDFMSLPYSQQPDHIIDMIKSNVNTEFDFNPAGGKVFRDSSSDTVIDNLKTPLGTIQRFLLSKILQKSKAAVKYRELTKSKSILVVNEIRTGIRGLNKLMVNEGLLPDSELIYHMTKDEIKKVILFRDATIVGKATRRQKLYPDWAKLRFPIENFGVPRPIEFQKPLINNNESKVLIKGTIVCTGLVEGRACVVKDFSEVTQIQRGDILITYSTDICWSPYFPLLKGLCTELGGLISHSAVVSREYNLPCIVGAKGACSLVSNGQMVLLNADEGLICSTD